MGAFSLIVVINLLNRFTMYHCLKPSLILTIFLSVGALKRKVSPPQYNPGCDGQSVCTSADNSATYTPNVVMTQATCATDTLYYIWSTMGGSPSLILLRTEPNVNVSLNWDGVQRETSDFPEITADGTILTTSAYVLTAIWKCKSSNPDATSVKIPVALSDCEEDQLTKIPLYGVQWYNNSHTIAPMGLDGYSFTFRTDTIPPSTPGELSIQITIYNAEGRADASIGLENALHSENSTQFMVVMDGFPDSEVARYSLEHLYIGQNSEDVVYHAHRGLNDEFTPGVFKYNQYKSEPENNEHKSLNSFFGWKDASYKDKKLDLQNFVTVYLDDPEDPTVNEGVGAFDNVSSLATSYFEELYGSTLTAVEAGDVSLLSVAFNMTFGSSEDDDGYDKYLAWEGQVGYGSIQYDELTALIISITIVGIVIPISVIIFGGVFVFVMKRRRNHKYDLLEKAKEVGDRTNYTDNESDTQRMI